jgi:hypothetical protein
MQRIKALSELLATEERLKKLPRRALAPDADDGE